MKKIAGGSRVAGFGLTTALAVLMVACGGGGATDVTAPTMAAANPLAGGWAGTSTSGNAVQSIILEDGRMWAIGGVVSSGVLFVNGLSRTTLQTSGSTLSASDLRSYSLAAGTSATGSLTGSFVIGTSLTATATLVGGAGTATINLAPAPATSYDYNTTATLAAVAGSWPGSFSNDTGTMLVTANGTFSATTSLGCRLSGAFTPRASGKNVYDITVSFGAAPCGLPNGSAAGNAIITNLTNGQHQLIVAVATLDGANGGVFFGQR